MIDTLILHGSFGNPWDNWFPWLAGVLQKEGRRVLVPHFPSDDLQTLRGWTRVLDSYAEYFSPELDVFAHSLAPAFIVDYCCERQRRLRKATFVAPFYGLIGIEEFDRVNNTFFVRKEYFSSFKMLCDHVACVYSDDDPYVPKTMSEEFARLIGAHVKVVSGGKHLNASAGFREFPLLLSV